MEGDYSQLENLIQDVSNLDTARMTLRWALERLNSLEGSNRELDAKYRASTEAQKNSERRMQEMEQMVGSRMKLLDDQEAFYKKLEQTVALLSEGKVDLAQLAKKEVDLDHVRKEMAEQHRKQFEDLERSHLEMVAHWTERLSKAEAYNPELLAKALQQYDQFRRDLEQNYQKRQSELEQGIRTWEEEVAQRELALEAGYQAKFQDVEVLRLKLEAQVQDRLREIETTFESTKARATREIDVQKERLSQELTARKQQLEGETQKLQDSLHSEFQQRTTAWYEEQQRRLSDLQNSWTLERDRLQDEQKSLQFRLQGALARIQELQDILASSDSRERDEIVAWLADAERAFQVKTQEFMRVQEDARAQLDERARHLEEEYAARRQKLESQFQEWKAGREEELERRISAVQQETRFERSRMAQQLQDRESMVHDLTERLEAVQHKLIAAESTDFAKLSEELRATLNQEMRQTLEIKERELAEHLQVLQDGWTQERDALKADLNREAERYAMLSDKLEKEERHHLREIQAAEEEQRRQMAERDAVLAELRERLRGAEDRLSRAKNTEEAEALEALRKKLAAEFQSSIELAVRERDAAHEQIERVQEENLKRMREAAEQQERQLAERDAVIDEIRTRLREAEERMTRAQTSEVSDALDKLRATLTAEFEKNLKNTEDREAQQKAQMVERWGQERLELEEQLRLGNENLQVAYLDKIRVEQAFELKVREIEKIQADVNAKADALAELSGRHLRQEEEYQKLSLEHEEAVRDLRGRLTAAEENAAREQAEKEDISRRLERELDKLREELSFKTAAVAELEERHRLLEAEFTQRRLRIEQEKQQRSEEQEAVILELRDRLQKTEDHLTRSRTTEREAALEALRVRLRQEFEEALSAKDQQEKERLRGLEQVWEAEREEFERKLLVSADGLRAAREEAIRAEAATKDKFKELDAVRLNAIAEVEAAGRAAEAEYAKRLKHAESIAAQLQDRLRNAEESLAAARSTEREAALEALRVQHARQMQERDVVLAQLREKLRATEDNLARAKTTEEAAALDQLRAQLSGEFNAALQLKEAEAAENARKMRAAWDLDHKELEDVLARSSAELQSAKAEIESVLRAKEIEVRAAAVAVREEEEQKRLRIELEESRKRKAEDERRRKQEADTESTILDLRERLRGSEEQLAHARSTELESALSSQKSILHKEFEAVALELRGKLQAAEQQLFHARSTELQQALQTLRGEVTLEFEDRLKAAAQEEASLRAQMAQVQEASALLARENAAASGDRLAERDRIIADLQQRASELQTELTKARSTEKIQAIETVKAQLISEFERRIASERTKMQESLERADKELKDKAVEFESARKAAKIEAESIRQNARAEAGALLEAQRAQLSSEYAEALKSKEADAAEREKAFEQRLTLETEERARLRVMIAALQEEAAAKAREADAARSASVTAHEKESADLRQRIDALQVELNHARSIEKSEAVAAASRQMESEFELKLAEERQANAQKLEALEQEFTEKQAVLDAELRSSKAAAEERERLVAELRQRLDAMQSELADARSIEKTEAVDAVRKQMIAEFSTRLAADRADSDKRLAAAKSELVAGLDAQRKKLETEATERVRALEAQLRLEAEQRSQLRAAIARQQEETTARVGELEAAQKAAADERERTIAELRQRLDAMQSELADARSIEKTEAVDAARKQMGAEFEARLTAERDEADKRLAQAAQDLKGLESQLASARREAMVQRAAGLESQREQLAAEFAVLLKAEKTDAQQRLRALEEQLKLQTEERGQLRAAMAKQQEESVARVREMESVKKAAAEGQDRTIAELRQRLDAMQSELADARSIEKTEAVDAARKQMGAEFEARIGTERAEADKRLVAAKSELAERLQAQRRQWETESADRVRILEEQLKLEAAERAQLRAAVAKQQEEAAARVHEIEGLLSSARREASAQRLVGLEAQREQLAAEFAVLLKAEKADAQQRIRALEEQLKLQTEERGQLRAAVSRQQEEAAAVARDAQASRDAIIAERDQVISELRQRLDTAQSELADARAIEKTEAVDAARKQLVAEFESRLAAERADAEKRLVAAKSELAASLEAQRKQWEAESADRVRILEAQLKLEAGDRAQLRSDLAKQQEEAAARVREMEGLLSSVRREASAQRLAGLEAQREQLAAEFSVLLKAEKTDAQQRIRALEEQLKLQTEERGQLRAAVSRQQEEAAALAIEKTEAMDVALKQMGAEFEARLSAERAQLRSAVAKQEEEAAARVRELEGLLSSARQEASAQRLAGLEAQRGQLAAEFAALLKAEKADAQQRISALEEQLRLQTEERGHLRAAIAKNQEESAARVRETEMAQGAASAEKEKAIFDLRQKVEALQAELLKSRSIEKAEAVDAARQQALADSEKRLAQSMQEQKDLRAEADKRLAAAKFELAAGLDAQRKKLDAESAERIQILEEQLKLEAEERGQLRAEMARMQAAAQQELASAKQSAADSETSRLAERGALIAELQKRVEGLETELLHARSTERANAIEELRGQLSSRFDAALRKQEEETAVRARREKNEFQELLQRQNESAQAVQAELIRLEQALKEKTRQLEKNQSEAQSKAASISELEQRCKRLEAEMEDRVRKDGASILGLSAKLRQSEEQLLRARSSEREADLEAQRARLTAEQEAQLKQASDERETLKSLVAQMRSRLQEAEAKLLSEESLGEAEAVDRSRRQFMDEMRRTLEIRSREEAERERLTRLGWEKERAFLAGHLERVLAELGSTKEAAARAEQSLQEKNREFDSELLKRLGDRDSVVRDLRDRLMKSEEKLARAESTDEAAVVDALREKLTAEFQEAMKAKDAALTETRRQLEEQNLQVAKARLEAQQEREQALTRLSSEEAKAQEVLRARLMNQFRESLKTKQAEEEARLKLHEETWKADILRMEREWNSALADLKRKEEHINLLEVSLREKEGRLEGLQRELIEKSGTTAAQEAIVAAKVDAESSKLRHEYEARIRELEEAASASADNGEAAQLAQQAEEMSKRLKVQELAYEQKLAQQKAQFNAERSELISTFESYVDELEQKKTDLG